MPVDAPSDLQSDYMSNQGPTLIQSRQHVCGRCNVVDPRQDPPFLLCVDHCRTLLPQKWLKSVIMYGVLRLGVSCSVSLSHSARPYSVSAWAALLLASFGFGRAKKNHEFL